MSNTILPEVMTSQAKQAQVKKDSLTIKIEMHGGAVFDVQVYIANLPKKGADGKPVRFGRLSYYSIPVNDRGYFIVTGNEIEAVLPHSGPFAFFFYWGDDKLFSVKLTDKKGIIRDGALGLLQKMTSFCENVSDPYQFSQLVNKSEQGKEQGLGSADENSGVITLHMRFEEELRSKGCSSMGVTRGGGTRGPPNPKTFNSETGYGELTETKWEKSNTVPLCKIKTVELRIKVEKRDTAEPVAFASDLKEARRKFGPSKFVPDDTSDEEEVQDWIELALGAGEGEMSGEDEKPKSGDGEMSGEDEKPKSGDGEMSGEDEKPKSGDGEMSGDEEKPEQSIQYGPRDPREWLGLRDAVKAMLDTNGDLESKRQKLDGFPKEAVAGLFGDNKPKKKK